MAHLSPKKGGYPHKDQHDRTCVVDLSKGSNKDIVRGMVIRVNEQGEFEIAGDGSKFPMYLALQGVGDLQANMAGFFGAGVGPVPDKDGYSAEGGNKYQAFGGNADVFGKAPVAGPKGPSITGIHMDDGDVWQTDGYDHNVDDFKIGDALTVSDGLLTKEGVTADNTVGYVTAVPYQRWANDAPVKGMEQFMTGAMISVIDFQCGR